MYCTFCGQYCPADSLCDCNTGKIAIAREITCGAFCTECGQQHCWHVRPESDLSTLRAKVDLLDEIIVRWKGVRVKHTIRIGVLKRSCEMDVCQPEETDDEN